MELLDRITNKVGPLPAWAWAAIPAAGYVAYSYWKASQGDSVIDPAIEEGGGGAEGTDYEDYGINTGAQLPGYGSAPTGSSNAIPGIDLPKYDNQTWFRQASNWLISEGVISTDVVTALNAYLYGSPETITATQMNALQRAIMKFGAAPDPAFVPRVQATPVTPKPTTPKPTTPSKPVAPGTVRNLRVFVNQPNLMRIRWEAPSGGNVLAYQAQVKGALSWGTLPTPASWYAEWKSPRKGQTYTFRVRARNAAGYGPWATTTAKAV